MGAAWSYPDGSAVTHPAILEQITSNDSPQKKISPSVHRISVSPREFGRSWTDAIDPSESNVLTPQLSFVAM